MDEISYQELINKLGGLSQKAYALARTMERFHKTESDPEENPMPVLELAKEFLQNTSFFIDTLTDKMEGERDLVQAYLADCGHADCL